MTENMEKVCSHFKYSNSLKEDEQSTDNKKTPLIVPKQCPITKITNVFKKQFMKFYLIRFLLSLLSKIFKVKFNIFKLSASDIFNSFFNMANLKTGLFLSLMPSLFRFLNLVLKNSKSFKGLDERLITCVSGFLSSLLGIIISEKNGIMDFIILSVLVRTLHSILVVWLRKNGYPVHNRLVSFLVLTLACSTALFIYFCYPSFKPLGKLIDRYALFTGTEKVELYAMREILRVDK